MVASRTWGLIIISLVHCRGAGNQNFTTAWLEPPFSVWGWAVGCPVARGRNSFENWTAWRYPRIESMERKDSAMSGGRIWSCRQTHFWVPGWPIHTATWGYWSCRQDWKHLAFGHIGGGGKKFFFYPFYSCSLIPNHCISVFIILKITPCF